MSRSPGGRADSPSSTASSAAVSGCGSSLIGSLGSSGSNGNGCRHSGASFDSGRATASSSSTTTAYAGGAGSQGGVVRPYSSALSSESSLSFRNSYHSSSSSLGSIPSEEIRNFDVGGMILEGVPDSEVLIVWLTGIHLECYYQNFIQAGYDMHTISRMTPEDLNAIGVTKPHHRKKIKSEISQLNIGEGGLPNFIPETVEEWLRLLKLEEYLPRLLEQGYRDVRQATNVTWEDLDDIGILKLGHQKKFMLAIKRIQDIAAGKHKVVSQQQQYLLYNNSLPPPPPPAPHPPQLPHLHSGFPIPSHPPQPRQLLLQQQLRHCTGMSYPQTQQSSVEQPYLDPRHHIQRNAWLQQAYQGPGTGENYVSHQIQVHHQTPTMCPVNGSYQAPPLYHPEVISIRIKNGHGGSGSLDSPPEEEPIYGTSSFLRTSTTTNANANPSSGGSSGGATKSLEEGDLQNGYGGGGVGGGGKTSSSWTTLPRLQKHKPINKVMGGGVSNCDSSGGGVSYPINPGPFGPHYTAPSPPTPPPSTKAQPPPPPRRSSCSSSDLNGGATSSLGFRAVRRNGSDASFNSTSSTESESLPFANENAGTIKQQKPNQQRPPNGVGGGGGGGVVLGGPEPGGEDVLSDIGSMLADLTDQLDAILEQERTSKRH